MKTTRTKKPTENKYVDLAAKMSDAELRFAHDDICEVFASAIQDGRVLAQRFVDELHALQTERGRRALNHEAMATPDPPHWISYEAQDGQPPLRPSRTVRVF